MKVNRTLRYKIVHPNKGKALAFNQTVRQFRKCVNFYLHEMAKGIALREIYHRARKIYDLPSALVQTARDFAKEQLKSYENNDGNSHFPHFDGFIATRYDKRTISFKEAGNRFEIWASIATIKGRVRIPITSCDEYIEELKGEEFESAQLLFKDGEFFLHVIFEDEKEIPAEEEFEHFIGIDLGIKNLAVAVVMNRRGDVLDFEFLSGNKLQEKRRRFRELRRELGKKKLWGEVKKSKGRERNYIKDQNHKISKTIVDMASRYEDSVIVMEKLDGIREHMDWSREMNWKLHNWPFRELQDFISYKAHNEGIAVRRVDPKYTSQVCGNCLERVERVSQSKAVCQTCKKEYNADWLGASNLVRRLFGYMSDNLGDGGYRPEQGGEEPEGVTGSTFGESKGFVAQLRGSQP